MTKHRISYILLLIGAVVFSQALWNRLSTVTLIATLLLPILSFLLFLLSIWGLRIQMKPATALAERRQNVEGVIIIRNKSIFPLIQMRMSGTLPNEAGDGVEKQRMIFSMGGRKSVQLALHMCFPYRGEYKLSLDYVEIYDLLKLFKWKKRLNAQMSVIVVPRRFGINSMTTSYLSEEQESTEISKQGFERADVSAIREYQDGDLLKSVHWKLSAKLDEMLVKVYDENTHISAVIVADLNAYYDTRDRNCMVVDAVIETTLALSYRMMVDGQGSLVLWQNQHEHVACRQPVTVMPEFAQLFQYLSVAELVTDMVYPEGILSVSSTEMLSANGIFIVTSNLRDELITSLLSYEKFLTTQIHVLYIDSGAQDTEALINALAGTSIHFWRIDQEEIAESINYAMEKARE